MKKVREGRSVSQILPTEEELDEDVSRKLHMSNMYYFLNVPDTKVPSATNEGTLVSERNEVYAEVCVHS